MNFRVPWKQGNSRLAERLQIFLEIIYIMDSDILERTCDRRYHNIHADLWQEKEANSQAGIYTKDNEMETKFR